MMKRYNGKVKSVAVIAGREGIAAIELTVTVKRLGGLIKQDKMFYSEHQSTVNLIRSWVFEGDTLWINAEQDGMIDGFGKLAE